MLMPCYALYVHAMSAIGPRERHKYLSIFWLCAPRDEIRRYRVETDMFIRIASPHFRHYFDYARHDASSPDCLNERFHYDGYLSILKLPPAAFSATSRGIRL